MQASSPSTDVAAILLAKNEGERFRLAIEALLRDQVGLIIYVDSGSTDGSLEFARDKGIEVIDLDVINEPFTYSRARNTGFEHLKKMRPDIRYVQFLDGDCELHQGWMTEALEFLDHNPDFTGVCGYRNERHPEQSIYNRQIAMEWPRDHGEVLGCGGDFLLRREAFEEINGFDTDFIGGEDPEFFIRLKKNGHRFFRLDRLMTEHDVNMRHFSQWWTRAYRNGHGNAHIFDVHGKLPQKYRRRSVISSIVYGAVLPLISVPLILVLILLDKPTTSWSLITLIIIALLYVKIIIGAMRSRLALKQPLSDALLYAGFILLSKPAEFLGIATYFLRRVKGKGFRSIDYRSSS